MEPRTPPPLGPKPRLLCVDDEPHVLEGLKDNLRRMFNVSVATSGAEALRLLRADPQGFAVVISDMRMPGMSGATFLAEARRVAPLSVRMLLTGYADADSAMRAVNDGQIFRFLVKPCGRDDLARACMAALWQHRMFATERLVLEQTLRGSVEALTAVLGLASPAVFGRGERLKRAVTRLASAVGLDESWEVEVAAMLAFIGAVTLPGATAEKLCSGGALSDDEAAMVARVPAATERILANIPRLEGVQQILSSWRSDFDPDDERPAPVGARILRIAIDFDDLVALELDDAEALSVMRGRALSYDVELLDAFAGVIDAGTGRAPVREITLEQLDVGSTLVADVRSQDGRLLIARGHTVTPELIERLRNLSFGLVREPLRVIEAMARA